jgi:hypothetical protein
MLSKSLMDPGEALVVEVSGVFGDSPGTQSFCSLSWHQHFCHVGKWTQMDVAEHSEQKRGTYTLAMVSVLLATLESRIW